MTAIHNVARQSSKYTFRVQGANPRGGCLIALLCLVHATIVLVFGYALMSLDGPWPWLSIPASFGLLYAGIRGLFWTRELGTWAPWSVTIDTTAAELSCKDKKGATLWTVPMDPDHLYIAPMKLREGDARIPPWILAYSSEPTTPVVIADPTPEHVALAEGKKDEVFELAEEILNDPSWPRATPPDP